MRFGARTLLFPGLTLVAAGLVLFTRAPVDANYWTDVFPVLVLMGTGIGVCFPALMTIAMSGATRADAGLASGLVNTSAQVGGALGLAVLATLSTSRSNALEDAGHSTASALTSGYHLAFWIAAGLVVAAIGVAAVVLQPEAKAAEQFAGDEMPGETAAVRGNRIFRGRLVGRGGRARPRKRPHGRHHDHGPHQRPATANRDLALPLRRQDVPERFTRDAGLVRESAGQSEVHLPPEGQRAGRSDRRRPADQRRG